MNDTLNGKWSYLSFRHDAIVVKDDQVVGNPELAAPWSPPGILEVTTSASGDIKGTLTFPVAQIALNVTGRSFAATERQPAGVELVGQGNGSVNKLKGFFVPGSDHVVGTILCTAKDLLRQPNGTAGPFVLVPVKA